jgi:arsenate reductase
VRFRFHSLRRRRERGLPESADDGAWGIPDPAETTGNPAEIALVFKDAYRLLNQRISIFVSLPLHSLDQISISTRLREIGEMEGATLAPERH